MNKQKAKCKKSYALKQIHKYLLLTLNGIAAYNVLAGCCIIDNAKTDTELLQGFFISILALTWLILFLLANPKYMIDYEDTLEFHDNTSDKDD